MKQSAAVGGDVLAVAGAGAEKGTELVIASTEPRGGPEVKARICWNRVSGTACLNG
jgi:hypothetical protein